MPIPNTPEAVATVRRVLRLPEPFTLSAAQVLWGLDGYDRKWTDYFMAGVDPVPISHACCAFGWIGALSPLVGSTYFCIFCGTCHTILNTPACAIPGCPRAVLGPHAHSMSASCNMVRQAAMAALRGASAPAVKLQKKDPFSARPGGK